MACVLLSSESGWQETGVTKKKTLRRQGRERSGGGDTRAGDKAGCAGQGGRAWREKWRRTSSGAGQRMLSLQDALWVVMATVIIYVNS